MKLEEAIKTRRFNDEWHKATVNILYTSYWLRNQFSTVLKDHDLTLEQHNVLRILKGSHPQELCVKDIASRIVEKSSNVPRIIDRLVIKKLVKRSQSKADKRETLVSLTEKGMAAIEVARRSIEDVTQSIANLTDDEAAMLNEMLEKIRTDKTPDT